MVRVCATEDCKTSARFNHAGEQKGKFCSRHKEPGMVDIVHPHCKIEGCTTLASFNMPGESRGEYCSQHKLEGMVNVKHRRCAENGCNTRPAFNWKGEEKGAYCNKHKEKGMVNVDQKEARADGGGGTAPAPRKRSKASAQSAAHDLQQQTQQEGYDPARLAQQLPDLAALATAEANGFMGMQHALQYGQLQLPPDFASANALGVNVPVALDPSQRHPQEQLAHQMDSRASHPGVAGVAEMSQAAWSAALQEQQRQEAEARTAEGQQLHPQLPRAPHQRPHGSMEQSMDQQPRHLQPHLVQHLQDSDAQAQDAQEQHHHHHHQHHLRQGMAEQPPAEAMHQQQEYGDQHQPEPSLPSAEELREQVALGEMAASGVAAAPAGSLGHLMLVHVIKFVRESLETQPVTDEGRQQLMMYTDHFSQWPEEKRVEEYAMLHFTWSLGRENRQQAILDRVEKVLAV